MAHSRTTQIKQISAYICSTCHLAAFDCPSCQRSKSINMSKQLLAESFEPIEIQYECQCGAAYTVTLERRKHHRKETRLSGIYTHMVGKRKLNKGIMTVVDVSRSGLKLKFNLNVNQYFSMGDRLYVEFHLDNDAHTLIQKEVTIKGIADNTIGVEFANQESENDAIGFFTRQTKKDAAAAD
jgi:hypothetical protein